MKNLFLMLAFMLVGSFAFANTNETEIVKSDVVLENSITESEQKNEEDAGCIHVSLSCGVEYDVCNFNGTTTQLINSVLNSNNNVCGTNFNML